ITLSLRVQCISLFSSLSYFYFFFILSVFHRLFFFFFFNYPATTEIYTLSLHDALPISIRTPISCVRRATPCATSPYRPMQASVRSEEHTSELQSRFDLVCRLLLEKKKINK